jgi:hypothetical protein
VRGRGRVRVRRGAGVDADVAAGCQQAVEGRPVDHQVANDRERPGAERLQRDGGAVGEAADVLVAGGDVGDRAVRHAVDRDAARTTDALSTVRIERNRVDPTLGQGFVEPVEQFEHRHVRCRIGDGVLLERSGLVGPALAPHSQQQLHA